MLNVSPTDILKILGEWTESSKFTAEVAKRMKVSERHAYRLIKKEPQILRTILLNGTVIYGLAEFGLPKTGPSSEKPSVLSIFSYLKWKKEYEDAKKKEALKELDLEYHRLLKKVDSNEDEWKP